MAKPYAALATLHFGAESGPKGDSEVLGINVANIRCARPLLFIIVTLNCIVVPIVQPIRIAELCVRRVLHS